MLKILHFAILKLAQLVIEAKIKVVIFCWKY